MVHNKHVSSEIETIIFRLIAMDIIVDKLQLKLREELNLK